MITREAAGRVASTGWDVLASDGSVVRIRPIRRDDEQVLSDLNHRVSERTIYLRFFGISRLAADEHTHHLVMADPSHGFVALVAEVDGAVAGVASYEPMRADEAEMAFLVDDAVHGRGIGTLLLEQLAAVARERGVRQLHADTLAENAAMLRVFLDSGFREVHKMDSGVVELIARHRVRRAHAGPDGRTGECRRIPVAAPAAGSSDRRRDRCRPQTRRDRPRGVAEPRRRRLHRSPVRRQPARGPDRRDRRLLLRQRHSRGDRPRGDRGTGC